MIATHHPVDGAPLLYVQIEHLPAANRLGACSMCALFRSSEYNRERRYDKGKAMRRVDDACVKYECYAGDSARGTGLYLVDTPDNRAKVAAWRMEK